MRQLPDAWRARLPLVLLCFVSFLFLSFLVINRYQLFGYSDWDMAFMNQTFFNIAHGSQYSTLYGLYYLGTHSDFFSFLIAPALMLIPHPLTFTIVQIICFAVSGFIFYLIIKDDVPRTSAFILTFFYLFFVPNVLAITHDHNTESLSPLFFLLLVYFFRRKRLIGFYVTALFFIMIKENMPLILAMFGIWGMLSKDRNRITWGAVPFLVSIVYFPFAVKVIDAFRSGSSPVWVRYGHLGATREEIFLSLLKPSVWVATLTAPENVSMLVSTFGIFLLFSIISPGYALLMSPVLAYHLLSNAPEEKTIYYSYALAMTPAVFLAAVKTCQRFPVNLHRWVLCVLFVGFLAHWVFFAKVVVIKNALDHSPEHAAAKWRLVHQLPKDASVVSTFEFLPALSLRKDLYSFHKVYSREYQDPEQMTGSIFYTGKPFILPANVQFALINFKDSWLRARVRYDSKAGPRIKEFLKDWQPVDASGSTVLFRRKTDG